MKRFVRTLLGVAMAFLGFFVTFFFLLMTTNGPTDYTHHRAPTEFCRVEGTVTSVQYAGDKVSITMDVASCSNKVVLYDRFVLSEQNRRIAQENGLPLLADLEGSSVIVMTHPSCHGDVNVNLIGSLSVEGTEYLAFEDGYANLCADSRRLQVSETFWIIVLPGGSILFFTWATLRLIRGKKERPPKLPYFRLKPFQKLPPKD